MKFTKVGLHPVSGSATKSTSGAGFTETTAVAVPEQPNTSVPVTVYVEVATGLTVTEAVLVPLSHKYPTPRPVEDAVSVAFAPSQISAVDGVMLTGKPVITVTVTLAVLLQLLASVPVTVYVVLVVGASANDAVFCPLSHE